MSFRQKQIVVLCFSFEFLVFQVVLIKLESAFQKNNLSIFNLALIWLETIIGCHETFSYMRLVLWH